MSLLNSKAITRRLNKIKDNREKKKKSYENNSGNWEYTAYKHVPEATILRDLTTQNSFNPKEVNNIRFPPKTKEQEILEKGTKLNTKDKIILKNYTDIKMCAINKDIVDIKTLGFAAKPSTNEGRKYLLLHTLDTMLQKKNTEGVANIYLRLNEDEFVNISMFDKEYNEQIEEMNRIVKTVNLIELQFTKFYSQMPPLNKKGFTKFDKWQEDVIDNVDKNISTVVNAPTSAGKTVLSGYAITKGDVLFVVPTDALAWQMAAYITNILGSCVPILTKTHQTCPGRDDMIALLKKSSAIVGTPDCILDFLPTLGDKQFKWIIFDEIHMIGKPEGSGMEQIAKIFPNTPVLALSATIGNTDELVDWFKKISPNQPVEKVVCDKRFFNLQRYYYDNSSNELVSLHPLALITEEQIADKSILSKNLQPTPLYAWDLAMKLKTKLGDLDPNIYFSVTKRIELDDATVYFNKLIEHIVELYTTDRQFVMDIINSYKNEQVVSNAVDLVNLAYKLKENDKAPAIFFQENTIVCLQMVYDFAKDIEERENTKYPKLFQERLKIAQQARRLDKNKIDESSKVDSDKNTKKALKEMIGKTKLKKDGYGVSSIQQTKHESIVVPALQEPHPDFILSPAQYFTEGIVEKWYSDLKKYFPNTGEYYHWIIKLLWRGVGVYAKGLPDPYLRLVQTLACMKQLAIVFSDKSLVFGVSMPFRTAVIIRDSKSDDTCDSMLFHQMSGRAGRRGLDKEGNVVFAGYSWSRIKELSISTIPIITGTDNVIYTIPHANKLALLSGSKQEWENTCKNFLDKTISVEDTNEFLDGIKSNYMPGGGWSFALNDDINHLHMNWRFRSSEDSVLVSFLIPYFRRAFEGKDHTKEQTQILLAHFLLRFISTKPATKEEDILVDPAILSESPYDMIIPMLEELQISVPAKVDNKIFLSIQMNSIITTSTKQTDVLRQRLVDFGEKIKHIQHYCYHSKIICLSKIMGKLLTRIWWIYHTSSPIMKSFTSFNVEPIDEASNEESSNEENSNEDDSELYESDSDNESSEDEDED